MNWIFVIGHSFKAVEGYPLPQAIFSFNIYVEGQPKKNIHSMLNDFKSNQP